MLLLAISLVLITKVTPQNASIVIQVSTYILIPLRGRVTVFQDILLSMEVVKDATPHFVGLVKVISILVTDVLIMQHSLTTPTTRRGVLALIIIINQGHNV